MDGSHNKNKEKDNGSARNSNTRRAARGLLTSKIGSIFTIADGLNERGPESSLDVACRRGMGQCERSYLLQTG